MMPINNKHDHIITNFIDKPITGADDMGERVQNRYLRSGPIKDEKCSHLRINVYTLCDMRHNPG